MQNSLVMKSYNPNRQALIIYLPVDLPVATTRNYEERISMAQPTTVVYLVETLQQLEHSKGWALEPFLLK